MRFLRLKKIFKTCGETIVLEFEILEYWNIEIKNFKFELFEILKKKMLFSTLYAPKISNDNDSVKKSCPNDSHKISISN